MIKRTRTLAMDCIVRRSLLFPIIIFSLIGCKNAIRNNDSVSKDIDVVQKTLDSDIKTIDAVYTTSSLVVKDVKDLYGYWVGWFEPGKGVLADNDYGITTGDHTAWDYRNKINISIDSINGFNVFGHSVVAGNARPFKGSYTSENGIYTFDLKEPGDDKYDGAFHFTIAQNDTVIRGEWNAFGKIKIFKRSYELEKKIFKYDPTIELDGSSYVDWQKKKGKLDPTYFATTEDAYKYNASKEELSKEKVSNLKKADLFIIRNSIYARHGFSFKNQQLRAYFDKQDWYIPVHANIKDAFTELEKKNIQLLLRYEKNASEYYDVFGR